MKLREAIKRVINEVINESIESKNDEITLKVTDKIEVRYGSFFVNGKAFEVSEPDESVDWPKSIDSDGKLVTWFKGRKSMENKWSPEEIRGHYISNSDGKKVSKKVTVYRGTPEAGTTYEKDGRTFWTETPETAKEYGTNVEKRELQLNNPLETDNHLTAKQALNLPSSTYMSDLLAAAEKAGYDSIIWKHHGKTEYVKLNESAQSILEGIRPQVGDKVKFDFKGQAWEGTIAELGSATPGKIKLKKFSHFGVVARAIETAKISVVGKGIATVPLTAITKIIGRGDGAAARKDLADIKASRATRATSIKNANYDAQDKNSLSTVKPGDAIIVTYNGGDERERKFLRFTSSGSVVYDQNGRERKCPAEFVRIAKKQ